MIERRQVGIEREHDGQVEIVRSLRQGLDVQTASVEGSKGHGCQKLERFRLSLADYWKKYRKIPMIKSIVAITTMIPKFIIQILESSHDFASQVRQPAAKQKESNQADNDQLT